MKAAKDSSRKALTKPETRPTEEMVSVQIPKRLYDDLRRPPAEPEPPKTMLADDVEEIGREIHRIAPMLRAMHTLVTSDLGDDEEVLRTVVERFTRDALIQLDDCCEKLGCIRMGYFDEEPEGEEVVQ